MAVKISLRCQQWLWFIFLWSASLVTVTMVAATIKWLLPH